VTRWWGIPLAAIGTPAAGACGLVSAIGPCTSLAANGPEGYA